MSTSQHTYVGSDAAKAASAYFNALPIEERAKLEPLLEHYRQMGLAEAAAHVYSVNQRLRARIDDIRNQRAKVTA